MNRRKEDKLPRIGATFNQPHRPQQYHRVDHNKHIPFTLLDRDKIEMDAWEKTVCVACAAVVLVVLCLSGGVLS